MYINDINIIFYVLVGILGIVVGQFIDWCNKRLPEYKKVFSKEFFTTYMKNFKPNYILMFIMAIIYIALLYFIGWQSNFIYKVHAASTNATISISNRLETSNNSKQTKFNNI